MKKVILLILLFLLLFSFGCTSKDNIEIRDFTGTVESTLQADSYIYVGWEGGCGGHYKTDKSIQDFPLIINHTYYVKATHHTQPISYYEIIEYKEIK